MFSVSLTLEPGHSVPMYEQLYHSIADEIRKGVLTKGERLPSKRELCARLGVSRSTVETAYELLRAEGYVTARPRSGYYVADYILSPQQPEAVEATGEQPGPAAPGQERKPALLSTSSVDVSLFPYASWAKLYKEVVSNAPDLLQRGEPGGEPRLRQTLANLLSSFRGVHCRPEQLVVGSGIETLLGQLVTMFDPGAVYAMEDPGYPAVERLLTARGRAIRYVPLDGEGMDADALESSGADIAYLTPSHQFPLGITMPASRRSRLLRWASEGERYIIEDDYDSEFRYGIRPISSMQGMDRLGRVIYVGTFSRSLAPAIRLAYMVLPGSLLERWYALFGHQQPTVSRYEQTVMARFLEEGYYTRYLRRVGNLYAQRRSALLEGLRRIEGVRVSGADGGIHFLLTDSRCSETELLRRAANAGLHLHGLSEFCRLVRPEPSTLVVGYGGLPTDRVGEVVGRLAEAWR